LAARKNPMNSTNEKNAHQALIDHWQKKPPFLIERRLAKIEPMIKGLSKAWNARHIEASDLWGLFYGNTDLELVLIDPATYSDSDVLREFIHNLCTNLCAEKQILQGLLAQKT
jgi:hypothetical protein